MQDCAKALVNLVVVGWIETIVWVISVRYANSISVEEAAPITANVTIE